MLNLLFSYYNELIKFYGKVRFVFRPDVVGWDQQRIQIRHHIFFYKNPSIPFRSPSKRQRSHTKYIGNAKQDSRYTTINPNTKLYLENKVIRCNLVCENSIFVRIFHLNIISTKLFIYKMAERKFHIYQTVSTTYGHGYIAGIRENDYVVKLINWVR